MQDRLDFLSGASVDDLSAQLLRTADFSDPTLFGDDEKGWLLGNQGKPPEKPNNKATGDADRTSFWQTLFENRATIGVSLFVSVILAAIIWQLWSLRRKQAKLENRYDEEFARIQSQLTQTQKSLRRLKNAQDSEEQTLEKLLWMTTSDE